MKAGRYYVSALVELPDTETGTNFSEGIGIDLGLKEFAIVSNGNTYKNINKSAKIKKLEKKLRREQRCLSRKYKNFKKGESAQNKMCGIWHGIKNCRPILSFFQTLSLLWFGKERFKTFRPDILM